MVAANPLFMRVSALTIQNWPEHLALRPNEKEAMIFPQPQTLQHIASHIQAEIIGDAQALAHGINEIHRVQPGDLCFVDHPKYYEKCLHSQATHIIINTADVTVPPGKNLLVCADPFEAYLSIARQYRPVVAQQEMIASNAVIGEHTTIMPGVFIGQHVRIGQHCTIHPNAVIHAYTQIQDHVVVGAGCIVGGDAFYYNTKKNRDHWYKRMESCGHVVLENGVELGSGCTIDRGVTADTRIGAGTKLDNMVHIGHDTQIGRNCLLAAQVGVAGGVVIEDGVTLWGQVGVSKTLTIGSGAVVLAQSGVPGNLEGGQQYFGTPAVPAAEKRRELVWVKRIPTLWNKVHDKS